MADLIAVFLFLAGLGPDPYAPPVPPTPTPIENDGGGGGMTTNGGGIPTKPPTQDSIV
jgi:hypothetical protein